VRNVIGTVVVQATFEVANAILLFAALSFLGLGPPCLSTICQARSPKPWAACTYSSDLSTSTWPRTRRAVASQEIRPSTMITTMMLGVTIVVSSRTSSSAGMASSASTIRIMIESTQPPAKPATAPQSVPTMPAMAAAARPTSSEDWPATISRPSTLYPTSSVPRGNCALGRSVTLSRSGWI